MSPTNADHPLDAAHRDAECIVADQMVHINIDAISPDDARLLMSEEHKALGYRPPPHSLASNAQSAASKRGSEGVVPLNPQQIKLAALEDANRIKNEHLRFAVDLNKVGAKDAQKLMSEEHKALGYRPPPGSLAAQAQKSSAKHPDACVGLDPDALTNAARIDAEKIEAERVINLNTLGSRETRQSQSEEHNAFGYRPPTDSFAFETPPTFRGRGRQSVTKDIAAGVFSAGHRRLKYPPPPGAQSITDRNEVLGSRVTLREVGP